MGKGFFPNSPQWATFSSFTRFLDHTQRRTTDGRTLLDERSAHRRDLYLTTHNTHNRQTSTSQHTTLTTDRPLPHNTQHSQQADLCLTTQHSQQTNIHAPSGIRTHNPSKRAAADPRLRPRGHRGRRYSIPTCAGFSRKFLQRVSQNVQHVYNWKY